MFLWSYREALGLRRVEVGRLRVPELQLQYGVAVDRLARLHLLLVETEVVISKKGGGRRNALAFCMSRLRHQGVVVSVRGRLDLRAESAVAGQSAKARRSRHAGVAGGRGPLGAGSEFRRALRVLATI